MKKLLTVPVTLLASMALLVSCSGGQKKSEESIPVGPESSESSEVTPEPSPEKEDEIIFPESIAEAEIVDFGALSYNYQLAFDIYSSEKGTNQDFLKENASKGRYIYSSWGYNFEGEYGTLAENEYSVEFFEDNIFELHRNFDEYVEVDIGTACRESERMFMKGVTVGETDYVNTLYLVSGEDPRMEWGFNYQDYAGQAMNEILYNLNYGYMDYGYKKIGDYHYFINAYISCDTDPFNDYAGNTIYAFFQEKNEIVFKFDEDYKLVGYYSYYECTIDHDLYSGRPLKNPVVFYKSLGNISFEYKENNVYPNKDALVASVPDVSCNSASFGYRTAKVRLGESGQLIGAPEFPESYTSVNALENVDNEHLALYFVFDASDNYAISFSDMSIYYLVLQGEEMHNLKSLVRHLNNDVYLRQIADALGASIKTFNEVDYLIMAKDTIGAFRIVFPKFEEVNDNNFVIEAVNTDSLLFI